MKYALFLSFILFGWSAGVAADWITWGDYNVLQSLGLTSYVLSKLPFLENR